MATIDGIATGLDTTSIIESLLSIQQGQIDTFNARKQRIEEDRVAFRGIEARLLTLQSNLNQLSRPGSNAFLRKTITSSNETAVTASVSNDAAVGTYTVTVNRLATNHQVASQKYARTDAAVAKGSLEITVGQGESTTVTIDANNNSLSALADSINASVDGVTAMVIKDGSEFRLLLSSDQAGEANAISSSFTIADAGEASLAVAFDFDNPVQEASDAELQIGSGAGAITTTTSSNQVDDLFTGITLDIRQANEGEAISLTVSRDTEAARGAIQDFVDAYNDVIEFTNDLNQYDPESGTATSLFGNRTLLSIRAKLSQAVSTALPFKKGTLLNRLSSLGIREEAGGRLSVRSDVLGEVLSGRRNGVSISETDIAAIFGYSGESTSTHIKVINASAKTQVTDTVAPGGDSYLPYTVTIVRAAEQASITATNDLANSIVIDDSNNTLNVSLDKRFVEGIRLTNGTYTPQELADELEESINQHPELVGRQVEVSLSGQKLKITSVNYGLSSEVGKLSGSALEALGLAGSETDVGQDVAGDFSYLKDGQVVREFATGNGRVLTGRADNERTSGLQVRVTLRSDQVVSGTPVTADVTVTRGIAESLDGLIESLRFQSSDSNDPLKSRYGQLASAFREFDERAETIDDSIAKLNARFEAQRASLVDQFTALESRVSDLQSLGGTLATQLASLPGIRR